MEMGYHYSKLAFRKTSVQEISVTYYVFNEYFSEHCTIKILFSEIFRMEY